ncbi:uncharacterized protein LOC120002626 [Tripterygium wilfordii]|uniref:uncharacterized protein LOC120002626 n=1 Tax=Tripterygium wilfordii TaxID=458696 RepID=UPI0018F834DB|nr:uncharacterized protein LOC120002626 [Tripterygium wilfordii]
MAYEYYVLAKKTRVNFGTVVHQIEGTFIVMYGDLPRFYHWVYFMRQKSEVLDVFLKWKKLVETQTERKIKRKTKLDPIAMKTCFMVFMDGVEGFRLWCLESKKTVLSRDVTFDNIKSTSFNAATSAGVHAANVHSISFKHFLAATESSCEPKNFTEASKSPHWCEAMKNEINALDENNTWSMVKLPKDRKAIGSKWIYKIKYNPDGTIERYKARLVA